MAGVCSPAPAAVSPQLHPRAPRSPTSNGSPAYDRTAVTNHYMYTR